MIYLASPYSHDDPAVRFKRFNLACAAAGTLMREGLCVFSPISHTHPIAAVGELPLGWDFWEKFDREMIGFCSAVLVLTIDGWRESKGVQAEIAIATEMRKRIGYLRIEADENAKGRLIFSETLFAEQPVQNGELK